jgi:hypothetical protein
MYSKYFPQNILELIKNKTREGDTKILNIFLKKKDFYIFL